MRSVYALVLLSGCSFVVPKFEIPPCGTDEECEPLNVERGIEASDCERYQCVEEEGYCRLGLRFDEDEDADGHAPLGATCPRPGIPADDCADRDVDVPENRREQGIASRIHPGASEICDGIDDDCDGTIDQPEAVLAACQAGAGAASTACDSLAGSCVVLRCPAGAADCDGDPDNGCESTLASDVDNCGWCGVSCGLGGICSAGLCDRLVGIGAGEATACAVRESGALVCWGRNSVGMLGDGTLTSSTSPVLASALSVHAVQVSVGGAATCVRADSGSVECFGSSAFGGGSAAALGGLNTIDVAVGQNFACAVESSGSVVCWGANGSGQLGDGTNAPSEAPVPTGLTNALQVSAGESFACALDTNGAVWCWGETFGSTPAPLANVPAGATELSAGGATVCVRATDTITCWGADDFGQRGDGDVTPLPSEPSMVALPAGVVLAGIAVGEAHACALATDGRAWCWGRNDGGQLGNESTTNSRAPVEVSVHAPFTEIAAGGSFTCARSVASGVLCWGRGGQGQLGTGMTDDVLQPSTRVPIGAPRISVGGASTCARAPDGTVLCWGHNATGELGVPPSAGLDRPIPGPGPGDGFVAIDVETYFGRTHACGLRSDGTVRCWGFNGSGQLGDETKIDRSTPVQFGSYTDVVQVVAGGGDIRGTSPTEGGFTCVLRANGEVHCAGDNRAGTLGDGTTTSRLMPGPVLGIDDAVEISAGLDLACARRSTGELLCWGRNVEGELPDHPVFATYPTPVIVPSGALAAQIDVSGSGTCIRRGNREMYCSGAGADGSIGDGETMTRSTFTRVLLPDDIRLVSFAVGAPTNCALATDGVGFCWGANDVGQLGDGTVMQSSVPLMLMFGPIRSISTRVRTNCAVLETGQGMCMGRNDRGELGIGNLDPVSTPVPVLGF